jgi:hypothetical protein
MVEDRRVRAAQRVMNQAIADKRSRLPWQKLPSWALP